MLMHFPQGPLNGVNITISEKPIQTTIAKQRSIPTTRVSTNITKNYLQFAETFIKRKLRKYLSENLARGPTSTRNRQGEGGNTTRIAFASFLVRFTTPDVSVCLSIVIIGDISTTADDFDVLQPKNKLPAQKRKAQNR